MSAREVRERGGELEYRDLHPATNRPRYFERSFNAVGRTCISAETIRANAGAFKHRKTEIVAAQNRVAEHAAMWVDLHDVHWTDREIILYRSDYGGEREGRCLRLLLDFRDSECRERAAAFYGVAFQAQEKIPIAMFKHWVNRRKESMEALNKVWRMIVVEWQAGPHGRFLKDTKAGRLPFELLGKVLQAYLHA